MKSIAILGCGWLGFPLAKTLLANGMKVKGSTTSEDKLETFSNEGFEPYRIALLENNIEGDIAGFLEWADTLIIDIPPKAKSGENFTDKMRMLIPHIEKAGIGSVLFVSSTSVYGAAQGLVTEATETHPDTESGKQLLETEALLSNNAHFKTTILRFGGLIGGDRHPVKHLAGKENLPEPDAPVNLIHRDDCIGIITEIIRKDAWEETFNAVAPQHPTRKDYYTKKATEAGLLLPQFKENRSGGKVIDALKICQLLGYTFTVSI